MLNEEFISDVKEIMDELNVPAGTLSYPLPMYESEHRTALDGWKFKSVLWDLDMEMRATNKYDAEPVIKHGDGIELTQLEIDKNNGIYKATEYWRDRLWRLLDDHGVSLDDG